jgi:hypothetical protein
VLDGCEEVAYRTVLRCCDRWWLPTKIADPHQRPVSSDGMCSVPGCGLRVFRRDLCAGHHARWRRYGDPVGEPGAGWVRPQPSCPDCGTPLLRVALCSGHFGRVKAHGHPNPGRPLRAAPGTTWIDKYGYVNRTVHGVTMFEHRHVMEQHLGRLLWPDENVHHINGDRTDNRLANLELWSTSQPSGQRVADKLAHALEMVARYAPERLRPAAGEVS